LLEFRAQRAVFLNCSKAAFHSTAGRGRNVIRQGLQLFCSGCPHHRQVLSAIKRIREGNVHFQNKFLYGFRRARHSPHFAAEVASYQGRNLTWRCTCCSAGAGSGIGRAAALQFANAGCNIVAADINKAAAEETCSLVKGAQQQDQLVGESEQPGRLFELVGSAGLAMQLQQHLKRIATG
jgi:hypothetical protein